MKQAEVFKWQLRYVYGDGKYCDSNGCTECWNREMIEQ